MPKTYSPQFRRQAVELIRAGRTVAQVAADLGLGLETVYRWKRQDEIDSGERIGLSSAEAEELKAARRRIRELESELAATRKAAIVLGDKSIGPKDGSRSSQP